MKYVKINPELPIFDSYSTKEKVLAARGIAPENVEHYLHTSEKDVLSPLGLDNMKEGAELLAKHLKQHSKIYVVADSDVDGFTSAALLLNYLHYCFPYAVENNFYYGVHSGKQHGLSDQMENIIKSEYNLVILPDAGTNDVEYHKALAEMGIDVLCIDHHESSNGYSENAVIINNQLSENYSNKNLSGVGIVYKFCQYLDSLLEISNADYFLDLVAIGNVADMMDVRNYETKYLIEKGLSNIHNPYLKEAISSADYSISRYGGLCPHTVGFYVAPQINATIRFGEEQDKLLVFEAMLVYKGEELIPSTKRGCRGQFEMRCVQAVRVASNLKKKQDEAVNDTMPILRQIIEEKELDKNKVIAIKATPGMIKNKNITGLIANKLMKEYKHPVLLLNEREQDGEITWQGSARSVETPEFESFKDFMQESGYAFLAEGHSAAFGSGILDKDFEEFIAYSNEALADCNFDPCATVDFIWSPCELSFRDISDIAEMNMLYGQGLEQPKVAITNVAITAENTRLNGEKCPTLNINLGNDIRAIKFFGKSIYEEIKPQPGGVTYVNLLGTCSLNEFNGMVTAQIEIEDFEIVNKMEYYF